MKYTFLVRVAALLSLIVPSLIGQPAQPAQPAGNESKDLGASGSEVNLAVLQMGAIARGADQSGMQQVLAGQQDAFASLAPNTGAGSSVSVIQLGNATELTRVAIARVGSCPTGYGVSGEYCVASSENAKRAITRFGTCPKGYHSSGNYCLED